MRRITLWVLSTISALVLLFSYRTSTMGPGGATAAAPVTTGGVPGDSVTSGVPSASAPASPGPQPGGATPSTKGGTHGSFDGSVAQTMWGPVQVRITVAQGKITDVTVLQTPNGNFRDQLINQQALPILHQEALQAQSAQIDAVSGATVTSDGYRQSLQAAIDAAHLG
jgi:uncharacterized protein with FMN-binding domain